MLLEVEPVEVRMRGMGDEKYIRVSCPCCTGFDKHVVCNWCKFEPKDKLKHKHNFFYKKTIVKKKFFGLIKKVIVIKRCPCGEYKNEMVK